ncbi:VCBS repeat-containing protein [bacterium]|nr:VCBS repeat-containing protein [bacterium]
MPGASQRVHRPVARAIAAALPHPDKLHWVLALLLIGLAAAYTCRADGPTFTDVEAGLLGVTDSSVAWGDCDGDGDLDALVAGNAGTVGVFSRVYRNDAGAFILEANAVLPGLSLGTAAWVDYALDGRLDVFLSGLSPTLGPITRLYRNQGGGVFTWDAAAVLPGVSNGSAAWADYDGDGDPDLLLTGALVNLAKIARLYRNDGGGVFTEELGAVLPGVISGSVAWADFDLDGDPDILLTGSLGSSRISRIYRNDGGGLFAWETAAVMLGVANSSVAWADYDRDGDPDILLTGNMGSGLISWIYRNDGGGLFSRETRAALPGAYFSSVAWGDYDRDGDLDILLSGNTGLARIAQVWNNALVTSANQPPVADAGGPYTVEAAGTASWVQLDGSASSDPDGDSLLYQWFVDLPGAAFDDSTAVSPLLYFNGSSPMVFEVKLAVLDADYVSVATSTVTVVDTVPPTILVPDDIVEAPESPAGAVVTYAPLAADVCDPYPTVECDPPSGSLFAPGTTTTVAVTARDHSGNISHASFTVKILSQSEVISEMQELIDELRSDGALNGGQANSFQQNIQNILNSLAKGKTAAARSQLLGFMDKIREFVESGKIPEAEGQALLDWASSLLATLGG